jgi:hypothetical protein
VAGAENASVILKFEVEEGFLHSGTAKSAVPPVGMTNLTIQDAITTG